MRRIVPSTPPGVEASTRSLDPPPYDFPDLVVWTFEAGVGGRAGPGLAALAALDTVESRIAFSGGLVVGVSRGASERVAEEIESTLDLVIGTVTWFARTYSAVYDAALVARMIAALKAAGGSAEQARAIRELATYFDDAHPALSEALTVLAEVEPVLDAFVEWLRQTNVLRLVLLALVEDFGDLLGDSLGQVANLTGRPGDQGVAVGDLIGRFCAEVALMWMGW